MRLRIVQKHRQSFPMSFRTVGLNLFQPRAPTPNRSYRDRPVEFEHVARSRERIEPTADGRMPHASVEIEIVRSVSRLWRTCYLAERERALLPAHAEQKKNRHNPEQISNAACFGL